MKQYLKRSTAWMLCLALLLGLFAGIPGAVITKASAAETEPSEEVQNLLADYNASFEDHEIAGWTIDKGVNQSRQQATDGNAWSLKISVQDGGIIGFFGVEKGYKMIAEAGFEGIDWNINNDAPGSHIRNGTIHGNTIFEKPLDEVLAYYKPRIDAIKKNGLEISQAHAPFPSWTPEHPEVLDEMIEIHKRCIELCDAVGCKYLVIHGVTLTEIDLENTPILKHAANDN